MIRECNMVADELANFAEHMVHRVVWRDQTLICVRELLGCGCNHATSLPQALFQNQKEKRNIFS